MRPAVAFLAGALHRRCLGQRTARSWRCRLGWLCFDRWQSPVAARECRGRVDIIPFPAPSALKRENDSADLDASSEEVRAAKPPPMTDHIQTTAYSH
jgi:hypothetical protein